MRLITANLNGIRSAANKGFFDWLPQQEADAVGVQEVKAQHEDVVSKFCMPQGHLRGPFPLRPEEGLLRRGHVHAKRSPAS